MTLRILDRALSTIQAEAISRRPFVACGLLIGTLHEGAARVEKSLPCVNVAPLAARSSSFRIDPGAVVNVERSLRRTAQRILGFYYATGERVDQPGEMDRQHLGLWPGTILLRHAEELQGGSTIAWRSGPEDGAVAPLPLEVVATRVPALLACPE